MYDTPVKYGYCPICDKEICINTDDYMCHCPACGHHISLHKED